MADRLSELARQRALLSEHLAWLDREIADETVKRLVPTPPSPQSTPGPVVSTAVPAVPTPTSTAATQPAAPSVASVVVSPADTPDVTEILDQYRVTPTSVKQDVRNGCLLYFAAAFVLVGLVVAILYFTIGTHPVE